MKLKILTKKSYLNYLLIMIFISIAFSITSCYWSEFKLSGNLERKLLQKDFSNLKVRFTSLQQELINNIPDTDKKRLKDDSEKLDTFYKGNYYPVPDISSTKEFFEKRLASSFSNYNLYYIKLDELLKEKAKVEEFETAYDEFTSYFKTVSITLNKYMNSKHGTFDDLMNLKLPNGMTFKFTEFYMKNKKMLERLLRRFPYITLDKLMDNYNDNFHLKYILGLK